MKFSNFSNLISNLVSVDNFKSYEGGIFSNFEKINKNVKQSSLNSYGDYLTWSFDLENDLIQVYDGFGNLFPSEDFALKEGQKQNQNLVNFDALPNYRIILQIINRAKYFDNLNIEKEINYSNFNTLEKIDNQIKKFNYRSEDSRVVSLINFQKKIIFTQYIEKLSLFKKIVQNVNKYFVLENISDSQSFTLDNFDHPLNGILNIINNLNWKNENYQVQKNINDSQNLHLKNAFLVKLQNLKNRFNELQILKNSLQDFQNKKPINSFTLKNFETQEENIDQEILNADFNNNFFQNKDIIFQSKDSFIVKVNLLSRLNNLKKRKTNLEATKNFFNPSNVKSLNDFFKINEQTIKDIDNEIKRIDIYDQLDEDSKKIINDQSNVDLKNKLYQLTNQLKQRKIDLEFLQQYFEQKIKPFSYFETINQKTLQEFEEQIDKINISLLSFQQQEIINHKTNEDLKNNILKIFQKFSEKKIIFDQVKNYFYRNNIKNPSFFNKANQETLDLIDQEIIKLDNYHSLNEQVQTIIDLEINLHLREQIQKNKENLKARKIYIEKVTEYFDWTKILDSSFFNKANDETINLISKEVTKMNNYDLFQQIIKDIINHEDNAEFKNILQERFDNLITKKENLIKAKTYFDLTNIQDSSFFNKIDDTTLDLIDQEINKINNYDSLAQEVKDIVDHSENSEFKSTLETRLQSLQTKKTNLEAAKVYFDLTDVKTSSLFTKAIDETIQEITLEIAKINDYAFLSAEVKDIVDHNDNSEFKNALETSLQQLQTKKVNLEAAQNYFDLSNIQDPSFFNKTDDETINAISTEIKKINNYDTLSDDVKAIVDHNDNSEFKNTLETSLQQLQTKKTNLEAAKVYFDLTDVENASFFNKAEEETINAITTEINKINDYDSLAQEVKNIVDHNDNAEFKNVLNTRLQELQTRKANLELVINYFASIDVKDPSFFNKVDQLTTNSIDETITKVNSIDELPQEIQEIVNLDPNSQFNDPLGTRIQSLQTKKANLETAKTYFDLTDVENASFFNKANEETINAIATEINKIDDYNILSHEVKDIVNHNDNVDLKNALDTRLQELETKKINLEKAKVYFDLTDVENASFFNKANEETINAITTEINKINDYDTLIPEVKDIVDHNDNGEFKNALETTLQSLQIKKTNLESAKTYFDLTDVQDPSFFNKVTDETIEAITVEINKINDFDSLAQEVKDIVDHSDNSEFKNALVTLLQNLETKKEALIAVKEYFDTSDIATPETFNKANDETLVAIETEISKTNEYDVLEVTSTDSVASSENVDQSLDEVSNTDDDLIDTSDYLDNFNYGFNDNIFDHGDIFGDLFSPSHKIKTSSNVNIQKNIPMHASFFGLAIAVPIILLFFTLFVRKTLKWFKR